MSDDLLTLSEIAELYRCSRRHAVRLAAGRLQKADCWTYDLRALKKELQNFNAVTGKWKKWVSVIHCFFYEKALTLRAMRV